MYKIKYYIEDDIVREETCGDLDEACDTALAFDCPEFDASSSEDDSCFVGVYNNRDVCLFWANTEGDSGSDYTGRSPTINAVIDKYLRR